MKVDYSAVLKTSKFLLRNYDSSLSFKSIGDCMLPFYQSGDVLIVKEKLDYKVGEVILAINEDRLIAHRVLDYSNGKYLIKGDNSFAAEVVRTSDIIGAVIYQIRNNYKISYKIPSDIIKKITELSFDLNTVFIKCGNNVEKAMCTSEYKLLKSFLLSINTELYVVDFE